MSQVSATRLSWVDEILQISGTGISNLFSLPSIPKTSVFSILQQKISGSPSPSESIKSEFFTVEGEKRPVYRYHDQDFRKKNVAYLWGGSGSEIRSDLILLFNGGASFRSRLSFEFVIIVGAGG